jgi:membrane protein
MPPWLRDLLAPALEHPIAGPVIRFFDEVVGDYARRHIYIEAAAVSFFSLLSLIPLVVLVGSAAGYAVHLFGGDSNAETELAVAQVVEQLRQLIPYLGNELEGVIRQLVESRATLGLVGIVTLAVAASQVFRAIEVALAKIFVDKESADAGEGFRARNVVLSKLLFGGFILAIMGVFVILRMTYRALLAVVSALSPSLASGLEGALENSPVLSFLISLVVWVGAFSVVIAFFSPRRVRLMATLIGGAVFFVAHLVVSWGYATYLHHFARFTTVYGSFAALIILILWLFFLSTILLLCAETVDFADRRMRRRLARVAAAADEMAEEQKEPSSSE